MNSRNILTQLKSKKAVSLIGLIILLLIIPVTVLASQKVQELRQRAAGGGLTHMPLISRNVPAYASSGYDSGAATSANDNSFDTKWWGDTKTWLAYDLSRVPVAQRQKDLLVWYNESNSYDHLLINEGVYNMPSVYTIDINHAPGGGQPPTTGWQTVVVEPGNHYHSRQYVFDMNGANWVRINITGVDGAPENMGNRINMDIYDVSQGMDDDIIDYGDSITADAMNHDTRAGVASVGDLIHAALPDHFPVVENGGTGYLTSGSGMTQMSQWLSAFAGKYVGLSFGTNDSWGCGNPSGAATTVYNNYVSMIKTVIAARKVPIIALMPWSARTDLQTCAQAINAKLKQLPSVYSQAILGPDLYSALENHPEYFGDGIHPNDQGAAVYRKAWAKFMLNAIYKQTGGKTPTSQPTATSTPQGSPSPTLSSLGIHVSGNQLINDQGQQVLLHGVNESGAEYSCVQKLGVLGIPTDPASIQVIKSWHVNVVRLPVNEDCWLGINGIPPQYSGTNYQQALINYINILNQNGLYTIIDLQWNAPGTNQATGLEPMPDQDHALAFWTSVANTFKNNRAVIFDLFNEPFPDYNTADSTAAWTCMRDGGICIGVSYPVAGFQELVNAVRAAGAINVIMVPGIGYSSSLSQWLQYKPNDPAHNLAASWHIYNFTYCTAQSCWDSQVAPVAQQIPLIAGEIGENDCNHIFIDPLMTWLDQHKASYLGWAWNTGSCTQEPSLIADDNGTPTSYGIGLKDHLLALR